MTSNTKVEHFSEAPIRFELLPAGTMLLSRHLAVAKYEQETYDVAMTSVGIVLTRRCDNRTVSVPFGQIIEQAVDQLDTLLEVEEFGE